MATFGELIGDKNSIIKALHKEKELCEGLLKGEVKYGNAVISANKNDVEKRLAELKIELTK